MTTFTVSNNGDSGDGSLRQAIEDANNTSGADTIEFAIADDATITLSSGLLTISEDLEIDGTGQTIDANGTSSILKVDADVTATIDELTLTGGSSGNGAAINNYGTLTLEGTTVTGNTATGYGGGIVNNGAGSGYQGMLTLTDSIISENSANVGGGIFNIGGSLALFDSTVTGNTATDGGGIFADGGTTSIEDSSLLSYNTASAYGGGLMVNNYGVVTITDSTVYNNIAQNNSGGGILNYTGTVTLINSDVKSNQALNGSGGGIFSSSGSTTNLSYAIINNNGAMFGGGIANEGMLSADYSTIDGNLAEQAGGVLNFSNANVEFTQSTISNNKATIGEGGGFFNALGAYVSLTNSTISSNTANSTGGGFFNARNATLDLIQSTVAYNSASDGGGVYNGENGTVALTNTTISGNDPNDTAGGTSNISAASTAAALSASLDATNLAGFTTTGVNHVSDGSLTGAGVIGGSALLGPLALNGGPVQTHALLPGSPLIDTGDNNAVPADLEFDSRGPVFARIVDGLGDSAKIVDIGAFEFRPLPEFPELQEGVPVVEDDINGVPLSVFVGDGSAFVIRFLMAEAAQQSSFGFYTIEDGGTFGDVTLLDANLSDTAAGTEYVLNTIGAGEGFGFFLAAGGAGNIPDGGSLSLVERQTGAPGEIDGDRPLVLQSEDMNGTELIRGVPVFHASNLAGDAGNPLHIGGDLQALSGINAAGNLQFAFEDIARGLGNSDSDFNDAVFEFIRMPEDNDNIGANSGGGYMI